MSREIRRAVPADAEALADLAARTFRDTFEADNTPGDMAAHLVGSYSPARQLAEITSSDIVTLLATCDGLAAFAQLRRCKPPACVTAARTIELWRFYVDKGWHGRGIAKHLMQAVLDEAKAAGATTVWLGVWERNPRAIAFYRKFGFEDDAGLNVVRGLEEQARRLGVSGVPFFIVNGKVALPGARPPDLFRQAFEQAGEEVVAGEVCAVDGKRGC
jgi:diamine N-acetyltransferase